MQISDAEKLILLMLGDIYEKLGIEGEIDAAFVKSAVSSGNTWGLDWEYSMLFSGSTQKTPPAVAEVVEILDMWNFIESGYRRLSAEDKGRIEKEAAPYGKEPRFDGFDGHNDSEQINIAHFLINDLRRFSQFKDRDLDSHVPASMDRYRRMVATFLPIRNTLSGRDLSAQEIIDVLSAQRHAKA